MMSRAITVYSIIGACLLLGFLTGCADQPVEELTQAREALRSAAEAEADVYAPEQYQAAQDALEAAERELEAQLDQSAMSRDYTPARELLQSAISTANAAAAQVPDRKETMRMEAETMIEDTEATAEQLAGEAERTRDPARRASRQEDIRAIRSGLEEARIALESGNVRQAHDRAEEAFGKASGIQVGLMEGKSGSW